MQREEVTQENSNTQCVFLLQRRTWRKIWMVLFKPSFTGVGRLEIHTVLDNNAATDQRRAGWQKTPEKKVVRLSDCLSVSPAPEECCPPGCTAFYLHTAHCTYTLASTTSRDWLRALCLLAFQKDPGESDNGGFERGNDLIMEDNDLYLSWKTDLTLPPNQYQVTVQATEASRRCRLAGDYLISLEEEAVILLGINTGHVIYRWPYRLLRKFGQVESGFSIEAGRRCESGAGLFIFLSTHGPQIYQTILKQCSKEQWSPVQPPSVHRRSSSDQSPVSLHAKTTGLPVHNPADVYGDAEDESADHYSTINYTPVLRVKRLSLVKPYLSDSKEAVGEKDEEEQYHSLEDLNLDNVMKDNIYYNLLRDTPPTIRRDEVKAETECIYSDMNLIDSSLNPQPQPFLSPLPQPLPQSAPYSQPKPRYQRQPPANIQPGYAAQAVDGMNEMEEASSSSAHATPTEFPGTFKHRLAEIISKDLAKFQPPLPPGAGSPTFSQ